MLIFMIILFFLGSGLLYWGADTLVKGSSRIAINIGIRPLIVGLTVIAMGTSAPELMVSLIAAIRHSKDIALGNIIGSNIANIGLVVGLAAVIKPVTIQVDTVRKEMPFLIGTTILFLLLSLDKKVGRIDGVILFLLFLLFIGYTIWMASRDRKSEKSFYSDLDVEAAHEKKTIQSVFLSVIGLVMLLAGSYAMVRAAVYIARVVGISEIIIGITMVAIGTSLPELAVSVISSFRGHADLAVGNAVGSNLFNMLFVISLVSMIYPIPVDPVLLHFEYPFMLGITIIFLPMMRTGFVLNRWEGGALVAAYGFFIYKLFF